MFNKIIIIAGATCVGKTNLSIELAKKFGAEIVNADSMQVYKYVNIGTSKITDEEMEGIKHHLIDIKMPDENYSLFDYIRDCSKVISNIHSMNKLPILVGGSGLYIQGLIKNYNLIENNINSDIFLQNLHKKPLPKLLEILKSTDTQLFENIDKNNKRRVVRAICNKYISKKHFKERTNNQIVKYDYLPISLYEERSVLYERINKRVFSMIDKGLIEEVLFLRENFNLNRSIKNAIGYKECLSYINKEFSKDILINKIQLMTRRLSKKQISWFKNQKINYNYFKKSDYDKICFKIQQFIDS